jgi:hypothetical protein
MEIKDQQEEEVVVNQFEVEELEDRLENKWVRVCGSMNPDDCK